MRSTETLCLAGGLIMGLLSPASAQAPSPAQRLRIAEVEASVGAADSVAREIELLGEAKLSLRERHRMADKTLKLAQVAAIHAQPGGVLDICRAVASSFPHTQSAPEAYLLAAKTLRERLNDPKGAIVSARQTLAIPARAGFVAKTAYRRARSDALVEVGASLLAQGKLLEAVQACLDGLSLDSVWRFKPAAPLLNACRALAATRFVSATQVVDAVQATAMQPVRRAGRVICYRRSASAVLERLAQALARDGRNAASVQLRASLDSLTHRTVVSPVDAVAWRPDNLALVHEVERDRAKHMKRLAGWRARAAAGSPTAMLALGLALSKGRAVLRDTKASDAWIQRAADAGLPEACLERYRRLKKVQGRRYDPAVEGALLTQAGGRGSLQLWYHLSESTNLDGLGVARLKRELQPLAAKGSVWAYLSLGAIALRRGRLDRARTLLLRAGQLGEAAKALPLLLQIANERARNRRERLVLIRCAKRALVRSAPSLRSVERSELRGLRARLASASRAHPLAQDELSKMLAAGLGGARDRPAAGKAHYASLLARDLRSGYVSVEQPLLLEASTRTALLTDVRKGNPRALHFQAACLQGTWDLGDVTKIIPLHREDARRRGVAPCRGTIPDWGLYLEAEATLNAELAWARKHSARGDRWATAYLGYLSQQLLEDEEAAVRLWTKAAGMGCAWAAAKLSGRWGAYRPTWLRRAAKLGDRYALTLLASAAKSDKKPAEAKRWRLAAIAAGEPWSLREEAGRLLQANHPTQAAAVLRRLSQQGNREGYVALLLLLLEHPELRTPTDP